MPIYEYQSCNPENGCTLCERPFETIQTMDEARLDLCPECHKPVRKIISRCRAAVIEYSDEHADVEKKISGYEKSGRWSHAAELADTYSSETGDRQLKTRALDNYEKAGYSPPSTDGSVPGEKK